MKKKNTLSLGMRFIIGLILSVFFLLPTVLTVTNSFMPKGEIQKNYSAVLSKSDKITSEVKPKQVKLKFIPEKFSFEQYTSVFTKNQDNLKKYWNSIIMVIPIVIGQVIIALMAAYAFFRCTGKIYKILFFVYIILMLMPYQVMLVPNYLVADFTGLLNNQLSIILPGVFAPFSVFLLTKFMRRIPTSLIESSKIDGANEWQIVTLVCIPQCRSAIYSVAILAFIDYWNMVEQPIVLLSDVSKFPLSVYLPTLNKDELGSSFAIATLYMIPPLLFFLHSKKYLIEGITHAGSVKG